MALVFILIFVHSYSQVPVKRPHRYKNGTVALRDLSSRQVGSVNDDSRNDPDFRCSTSFSTVPNVSVTTNGSMGKRDPFFRFASNLALSLDPSVAEQLEVHQKLKTFF